MTGESCSLNICILNRSTLERKCPFPRPHRAKRNGSDVQYRVHLRFLSFQSWQRPGDLTYWEFWLPNTVKSTEHIPLPRAEPGCHSVSGLIKKSFHALWASVQSPRGQQTPLKNILLWCKQEVQCELRHKPSPQRRQTKNVFETFQLVT